MRLTYGQLVDAANAKRSEAWDHTSHVLALIYNVNTDAKSTKMRPDDFHPLRERIARGSNYTADKVAAEFDALAAEKPVKVLRVTPEMVIE